MRRAIVDVGSNSVLLVVAEKSDLGWQAIYESSEVTGLGTGIKRTGEIQKDAAERTLAAIKRAAERATDRNAKCEVVGTMALRIAKNAEAFMAQASRQGTPMRVLSGEEEAELGLQAVLDDPTFSEHKLVCVIDPGGNSTEMTVADRSSGDAHIVFQHSFPVGALGLIDGPLHDETPDGPARLDAIVLVDGLLNSVKVPDNCGTAIALGATPTNLASIWMKLEKFDHKAVHGAQIGFETVSKSVGALCDMKEKARAALRGIEPGREKTIHAGALILERFMNAAHVEKCFVSSRGWRHALAFFDEPRPF
ncbi:MAG TPA: hypothetical protein VNI20_02860 [Fimbriimonadaceae bacterium]|nr:hypothetical protein [Fimbriimonadaceae bacterium]